MKKILLTLTLLLGMGIALIPAGNTVQADDFIDLDLTGVAPASRGAFRQAELFWESRITGYSNNLPIELRRQLTGRLQINASTVVIDGPGGILGQAGPTATAGYFESAGTRDRPLMIKQYTIPTESIMQFDVFDAALPGFDLVVLHEMGHALGIGSLWQQNGLFDPADANFQGLLRLRNGRFQNIGQHALRGFREESGHHRANYVPTENDGLAGTALGHWEDDNWFFNPRNGTRSELMIGFLTGRATFVSEASWGTLADIGWAVEGFNAGDGSTIGLPSRPQFPKSGFRSSLTAVPEPSSVSVIVLGLAGLLIRRKRS